MIAAALERGIEVVGELELAWRALPNRFVARHRHQRQDDHGRAARPPLPDRRASRWRSPATSARRSRRWSARSSPTRPSSARLQLPARGHRRLRPRVRGLPQPRPRPPRPPRRPRGLPGGEAADLRQPGQRRRRRLQRRRPGAARAPTSAAAPAGSPSAAAPAPTARWRSPRGRSSTTASRCSTSPSSACSASTTSPTRWPPPPRRSRWASTATRCARACAASPASRTGSSRSPRSAASASSTTPRRPTSPPRPSASRAFEGGVHAILGGSEKGEPFAPLLEPVARALRRLLPDRRHRRPARRASWRRRSTAGVELHRCADLEDAVRRAAAAAAPGRGRPALARLRQLRRLRELRAARRALPRDRRGAAMSAAPLALGRSTGRRRRRSSEEAPRRRRLDRVQHAADRDPLPARARRGDGLLGQLDDPGARATAASPTAPST